MRKLIVLIASVAVLMVGTVAPAAAITGNFVEDFEHPYVGLVVFYDEAGEFSHRCSGSLLTPFVFLTAGHCTDGATTARIYFQQDAGANFDPVTGVDPVSGYPEDCAPGTLGVVCATSDELFNFGFNNFAGFPDTKDAGLVILDQPIMLAEYGTLAAAGTLDGLDKKRGQKATTFTASGYGLSKSNPVHVTSFRIRLMAESKLTNLGNSLTDGFNLQTNGNGNGRGGTCSGDSGGPMFYGNFPSNLIVAVTSFGLNPWCRGVDFSYRTDQTQVLDWIFEVVGDSSVPGEVDNIQVIPVS